MAQEKYIRVNALNIAANPHPPGVYIAMLRKATGFLVNARGSDYAKITTPRKSVKYDHLYTGRILVWTEIGEDSTWGDIEKEQELTEDLIQEINIPDNAKPNFRTFNYLFDEKRHKIYYESKNEFDNTLGPTVMRRVMSKLFSSEVQGRRAPDVAVTITPEEGAVERILSLPRLRMLHIRITKSNPDTASEAKQRVFAIMDRMHAKQMEQKFIKAAGADRLEATPEVSEVAYAAAENGFVYGEGRVSGKKKSLSTDELPKTFEVSLDSGDSFLTRILSMVKLL